MPTDLAAQRAQLLQQMAAISSMELGSLKAEYRTNASGQKTGPYYQHQAWQEGANLTRRVPAEDAGALEQAIANRRRFEDLANQYIALTVRLTRESEAPGTQKKKTPLPVVCSLKRRR
jgi:hypothetical protein